MTARLPLTAVPDPDRRFARAVRRLRAERDWTQEQLAAEAGISVASVSHVETGRHGASLRTAWLLSEALEADLVSMIRGEEP